MYLFGPSGGLVYHWLGFRRSRYAWASFRTSVRVWLNEFLLKTTQTLPHRPQNQRQQFIIFGPSAGWTLPLELLSAYELILVEPDLFARWILARRLRQNGCKQFSFINRSDLLPWFSENSSDFATFLSEFPDALILFANMLGQISLFRAVRSNDEAQALFLAALRTRAWASYHDLYSGSSQHAETAVGSLGTRDPAEAANVFRKGTVIDHETEWLGARERALWPLTASDLHVIGFVQQTTPQAAGQISDQIK